MTVKPAERQDQILAIQQSDTVLRCALRRGRHGANVKGLPMGHHACVMTGPAADGFEGTPVLANPGGIPRPGGIGDTVTSPASQADCGSRFVVAPCALAGGNAMLPPGLAHQIAWAGDGLDTFADIHLWNMN